MTSMLLGFVSWIIDFAKELFSYVPKLVYLLYTSMACVLDVLQLFFRKVAGLDVYYVNGKPVSGDIVTNFIGGILGFSNEGFSYSGLTTVFWAFVVFGIIMIFITTFTAIIKSHVSYDDKAAKGPMQYVYTAGKSLFNIIAVPVIVFLGLYVSQALLTAVDSMTSVGSSSVVSIYGNYVTDDGKGGTTEKSLAERYLADPITTSSGEKTYIFYDIFGFGSSIVYGKHSSPLLFTAKELALTGATNVTFSGELFKLAAFNANRARTGGLSVTNGGFTGASNSEIPLFANARTSEELATMIDTAFASNLHLKQLYELDYSNNQDAQSTIFTTFLVTKVGAFSKFNVGLVWYYYDLWQFNFIVAFAACLVCCILFINIILGLITRLFMCIGLFLIAPPFFGLAPLDGGKGTKSWIDNFTKQVLMAFGAVVGMNVFFLIFPYINLIDFFNIPIADYFVRALIIIVGLISIKAFIKMVSGLVGGEDANTTGKGIAGEVGKTAVAAAGMATGAALGATKLISTPAVALGKAAGNLMGAAHATNKADGQAIKANKQKQKNEKFTNDANVYDATSKFLDSFSGQKVSTITEKDMIKKANKEGFSDEEAKQMYNSISSSDGITFDKSATMQEYMKGQNGNMKAIYKADLKGQKDEYVKDRQNNYEQARQKHILKQGEQEVKAKARLKNAGRASVSGLKGTLSTMGSVAKTPFSYVHSMFKGSELVSNFKEGVKPKTDYAKETYKQSQSSSNMEELIAKKLGATPEEIKKAKKGK